MSKSFLERLPGEIITQIVETLESENTSSVFKLLFMKATKEATERVIYKSVIVPASDFHNPSARAKRLIDRVLNKDDNISEYIQELKIEQWSGTHYPDIFCSHLPNLKSLSFVVTRGANLRTIRRFLDSIVGLEELDVINAFNGFYPVLWSHVKTIGPTLRALKTRNIQHASWKWTSAALIELSMAPLQLQSLTIDLAPLVKINTNGSEEFIWPVQSFKALSRCSRLKTLNIAVALPNEGSGSYMAGDLMKEMFVDFFRHDPRSYLRTLELTTRRVELVPIQDVCYHILVVTVKRLEKDGAPSPLDGGFEGSIESTDGKTGEVRKHKF